MTRIICRSLKITTTETWTIVCSEEGKSQLDERPKELLAPDWLPILPELPEPGDLEAWDRTQAGRFSDADLLG
jgi:hypothetical protein